MESLIPLFSIVGVCIVAFFFIDRKKKSKIAYSDSPDKKNISDRPNTSFPIEQAKEVDEKEISASSHDVTNELVLTDQIETRHLNRSMPVLNIENSHVDELINLVEQFGVYDHTLELSSYKYPPLDLLNKVDANNLITTDELSASKHKIVDILISYNIHIEKISATIGPTVILYEILPSPGVRIAKIKSLESDIALSLAAYGTRVIGQIPGKSAIGIEVPTKEPGIVAIRSLLATDEFLSTTMQLPVALGKTMKNEVFITDLSTMPHLLIGGATGQGKSVAINAILVSLLYRKHPSEIKFVLIDINKIELTLFRKIERHFLAKLPDEAEAIITDATKATNTLSSLCIEMDQRLDVFNDAVVRNIQEYNNKFINRKIPDPERHRYLPYIVVIVDELADLMNGGNNGVESVISRLAQRGRSAGIHLIISTQRPSVKVITGSIKANFAARLAFRLSSSQDSQTILDKGGAENLKGNGDVLFSNGIEILHLQGAFVDTQEIERICDFIGSQRGYPSAMLLPEYWSYSEIDHMKAFDPDNRDPMFEEAARLIVIYQEGSTSLIQRKMKLGYNRAGRIIDQLEAAGILGPFKGSKAREVLYFDEYSLERHLEIIKTK